MTEALFSQGIKTQVISRAKKEKKEEKKHEVNNKQ